MISYAQLGEFSKSASFWDLAAKGGGKLLSRGGRWAKLGQGIQQGSQAMSKASPWLSVYGTAGMLSPMAGINLPGSQLAMFAGMPGWGAASAAPDLIRTGRLATGNHNQAIERDARTGAQDAAVDFLSLMHTRPDIFERGSYRRELNDVGATNVLNAADQFRTGRLAQNSGWDRLGYATGAWGGGGATSLIIPELQQQLYKQLPR